MNIHTYIKFVFPICFGLILGFVTHAQESSDKYKKENEELDRLLYEIKPIIQDDREFDLYKGLKLVELIAGLEVDSLYYLADYTYFSVLSSDLFLRDRKLAREELNRLKPIITAKENKRWSKLLRKKDERLITEIKQLWELSNPVLSTLHNERLIEHWNRVFIAKRTYTENNKSGFGTDDRGVLFLKLGAPHQVRASSISLTSYSDPTIGSQIPIDNNVYFRFEIWYYDGTQYIFGVPGTGGPFGLQTGILDLIPESGNRPGFYFDPTANLVQSTNNQSNNQSGVFGGGGTVTQNTSLGVSQGSSLLSRNAASLLLQYSVLEQVANVDPFYLTMYNRMSSDLIQNSLTGSANAFNSTALTQNLKYKAQERNWFEKKRISTPDFQSEAYPEAKIHNQEVFFFDFLDESGSPFKLMVVELLDYSKVQLFLASDTTLGLSDISKADYFYTYDQDWEMIDSNEYEVSLSSANYSPVVSYLVDVSPETKMFQSSFLNTKDIQTGKAGSIVSTSRPLQISGSSYIEEELGKKGLSISDLVLAKDQEESPGYNIPFFPSLDNVFDYEGELTVYFEAYGIPRGELFGLEYGKDDETNKLNVSFVSEGFATKVWIKVELDPEIYEHGKYDMTFNFTYRGKKIERRASITIK
ncbi:MAG: GWxTD domain-containing protein [Balneola sp.]|nr:MAG: GWxTD domain-containing protein [Balneola sp.]